MESASVMERYLSDARRFAAGEREPGWIRPVREAALARFEAIGFPSPRDEDWKYTNVSRVVGKTFPTGSELAERGVDPGAGSGLCGAHAGGRLVFVDGRLAAELSTAGDGGARIESLAAALSSERELVERHLGRHASFDQNGFTALSTAMIADGALVVIPDGAILERPLEIVFVATARGGGGISHPRVLVLCGRGSEAALVETYAAHAGAATLTNAVTEVILADGARLDHTRVGIEGPAASHVATTAVVVGRDARYRSSVLALSALFSRHELDVRLGGEGAECSLDGFYVATGEELVDNHTTIDHALPHGTSRELYKGVLAGDARAVFNGKVIVRAGAQKSDAQQTNKNLLLSGHAEINTKPELQIHADDVKCAHGAAIGQLDREALFYLKSRGIGEAAGRRLLTRAFAAEVIERIAYEPLRRVLVDRVADRLDRALGEEK